MVKFVDILKKIFETGTENFNEGALDEFTDVLSENIQFYTPEIRTKNFYTPKKHLKNKKEVLDYWAWLRKEYKTEITNFEYLEIGKMSRVRCEYEMQHYVIDSELYFDEYGKVWKIIHSHI